MTQITYAKLYLSSTTSCREKGISVSHSCSINFVFIQMVHVYLDVSKSTGSSSIIIY